MDEQRFDSLTRLLASGRSRRNVLRGLLGGVTGGLFARAATPAEAASPRPLRAPRNLRAPRALRGPRRCRADQSPDCAGLCCPGDSFCHQDLGCLAADEVPCANGSCPSGYTCTSLGMCLPPGGIECGGGYCEGDHVCVNGQGCLPPGGTACGAGYCAGARVCLNGQCERACDAGTTRCGQDCVDVASNPLHCGGCGVVCAAGQVCDGGTCACLPGAEFCGGECVDLSIDRDHCGACDTPCQAPACMDAACMAGQCHRTPVPNCCTEAADCDDGNPCTINTCDPETGTCRTQFEDYGEPCPDDEDPCTLDICDGEGVCVHPEVEEDHLCITPDGREGVCRDHLCVIVGPEPDPCEEDCSGTCCDDICTDLQTDRLNCGACGTECADDEACVAGSCEPEECGLTAWRRYTEWVGTFTRISSEHSKSAQHLYSSELEIHAEVRLRLNASPTAPMFFLASYAGTCSVVYNQTEETDRQEPRGWRTVTNHAEGTEDISGHTNWALLEGGTVYGEESYRFRAEECTVPMTRTSNAWNGQTSTIESSVTLPVTYETPGIARPLPACPGPISGEWERSDVVGDTAYYAKETWSFSPVG